MTYFKTKETVKKILSLNQESRDSDNVLVAYVILAIEQKLGLLSASELLNHIMDGKYGQFESITRARRKWQEKHEDLRGVSWRVRHGYQDEVKKELKNF